MAVLEKIRVKFGLVISIIIALALLSFIIDPGTLESALNSMSSKYDVGKIAGKNISYNDFQEDVDKYTVINEMLSGSSSQNEQTQRQIRNAAWQGLLDKYMFVKNAKAAGICVGEDEMVSLVSGETLSPVMAQNPVFLDEAGNFSSDMLKAFIDNVNSDQSGQLRTYWNYLQNTIYNQQYYLKYGALFSASDIENALQLKQDVDAGNTTADVDWCLAYYPMTQDSTVTVSSDEIRKYYKDHKKFFKQNASRDIEYVVFEVVPSAEDVAQTSEAMDAAYQEFATTDNMKTFLLKNSERHLSTYWYKDGELNTVNSELNSQIFSGSKLSQIVKSGDSFYAAREMDSKMLPDSVYVKHILLVGADARHTADSLVNVLSKKGANFSNLASIYSEDKGSAADGELGSIGWMTQTYMIPGMESVIEAQVGKPFVLTTQYGTHVVLVSQRTKPVAKKQVAILEKTSLASKETFNKYYAEANTFATLTNGSYEGYKKAVDSTKAYSYSLNVTEATSSYGAVDQAKEVTRWIFDNKAGKASNIITVNNNFFFVAAVKDIHKEGYAPVKEVAPMIRERLYSEKIQAKKLSDVASKIQGLTSIDAVADALGVTVDRNEGLSLSSRSVDPAVLGAAAVAKDGAVFGPVPGSMGVYVLSVDNRQTGSFYTEEDAKNLNAQKSQYLSQMIISVMSEYDNVKDNRERFF